MYLTATNLAHYLIGRGLIEAGSVVDGDFVVIEAGRRNRNFKVLRGMHPGFFVKQISNTRSWEPIVTLQREAAFYGLVRSRPDFAPLARLVPRLVDYNPSNVSLIVDLIPQGENLTEYHYRLGAYPEEVGESVGRGLAAYHSGSRQLPTDPDGAAVLPRQVPWILNLDPATLSPLPQFGGIGSVLIAAMQSYPALLPHLLALRQEWRFDSLVHGDMKWDNLVVFAGPDGRPEVRVVDWELVDVGDAAWDVGAALAAYLVYGLLSVTVPAGQTSAAPFNQDARSRLAQMRPSMRKFWSGYVAGRGLGAAAASAYLERCVRFAAARLVLTVFECLYNAHQLTANLLAMLQASQTMFLSPRQAAADLLGPEAAT